MATDAGRRLAFLTAAAGCAVALVGCSQPRSPGAEGKKSDDEDIAPPEDLMREHGVLNRVLLIYEESARRIEANAPLPVEALAASAGIVERFIEQYHEKLEEDFLFPRFQRANKLVALVATLRRQHQAGRVLTAKILHLAKPGVAPSAESRDRLAEALKLFGRMYRPHEAREDTVLFPALRSVVPHKEFEALGDHFEEKEHQLFGKAGFEGVVAEVASLERAFGIDDLDRFTPPT